MGNTHEAELAPIIADIVVGPEEEELILHEDVVMHHNSPVKELIHCEWETTFKQV